MKMYSYFIVHNNSNKSLIIKEELKKILHKNNWIESEKNFNYVFVIGGDGTFLKCLPYYKNKKIIAINGGNLGYFSYFNSKNIKSIIKKVESDDNFKKIILLELTINNKKYYAINEIYLRSNHTLNVDVYFDDVKLQHFKGTGLMFSTTLGSTGHNKSAGGSIIFYSENLIQMLEIHPITQRKFFTLKSPIILNRDIEIKIKNKINEQGEIIIDGKLIETKLINDLTIKAIDSSFMLYLPKTNSIYIKKLKESFTLEK